MRMTALSMVSMLPWYMFGLLAAVGILVGSEAAYAAKPARTIEKAGASRL